MNKKIAIIGAGALGTAIAHVLKNKKEEYEIEMWDRNTSIVPDQKELGAIVKEADIIFLCIYSSGMRETLKYCQPYIKPQAIVVSPIKGIEENTLMTPDKIMADILPTNQPLVLLNGPMLSKEMMQDLPSYATAATLNEEAWQELDNLFSNTTLQIVHSKDVKGTALAGVLKNMYSIGIGMLSTLNYGDNVHGWFIQQAMKEMEDIIINQGGEKATTFGLAGLGDLVATSKSPNSRNYQAGKQLGETGTCSIENEGCKSLPSLIALLGPATDNHLILHGIKQVALEGKSVSEIFSKIIEKT